MDNMLPISALQHYAYCPRQFALIHVEQVWIENRFTAEGRILHERVDSGENESRGNIRYERGVALISHVYGLTGKMDLLEIEKKNSIIYRPVEYKRGKSKVEEWDRIQLCAQGICLEEMKNKTVSEGAIWYWESRQREIVSFSDSLRKVTLDCIEAAHILMEKGQMPFPISNHKRCRACSLIDICQPQRFRKDTSSNYIKDLFSE
ncbi:MAG: CRISPR-associated protein Cas4 [Candidatus Paceibacteria bacterium]